MDGKEIDTVREAILYTIATLSSNNRMPIPGNKEWDGVHKGRADSAIRQLQQSLSALSTIDHEVIRREARAKALREAEEEVRQAGENAIEVGYECAYIRGIDKALTLIAAILSAEPAQDDGKPEDER